MLREAMLEREMRIMVTRLSSAQDDVLVGSPS